MKTLKALTLFLCVIILPACGGGGSGTTSANAVNEYSFQATGGTLNDGSGESGLVVLATLRDSQGTGPGLIGGWKITITGPGITQPLTVSYDDGAPASYEIWRWEVNPSGGTYTATATNGATTLTSTFTIDSTSSIQQPPLTKSGSTISWTPVPGAGSYYYTVTDGTGSAVMSPGYFDAGSSATSYSFNLPTSLTDGSYSVEVLAHTESLPQLMTDQSPSPSLPSQENTSSSTMTFAVAGGSYGSYSLAAKGGTLYQGKDSNNIDRYGLVIWSSILTSTGSSPAGDWTVSVSGPGIDTASPLTFTYPATDSQYVYWNFGTVPAAGTYTVTATAVGSSDTVSAQFSIPAPTEQLPVETGISVTPGSNSYTINWNSVPGASSYYVNVWAGTDYTEVAGTWVDGNTFTAVIPKSSLTSGTDYDVYVTACTLDMTVQTVPPSPFQVNMSDNTYAAASFTAQ